MAEPSAKAPATMRQGFANRNASAHGEPRHPWTKRGMGGIGGTLHPPRDTSRKSYGGKLVLKCSVVHRIKVKYLLRHRRRQTFTIRCPPKFRREKATTFDEFLVRRSGTGEKCGPDRG